jgi:hypothetical protein
VKPILIPDLIATVERAVALYRSTSITRAALARLDARNWRADRSDSE